MKDVMANRGTIFCYGDSNTYGYDPTNYLEGRFPPSASWCGILERDGGYRVENLGVCGRKIPKGDRYMSFLFSLMDTWEAYPSPLRLWIMLGTNDLLEGGISAGDVAKRMEAFLTCLLRHPLCESRKLGIRLIAPPPLEPGTWVDREELVEESIALAGAYRDLALLYDIPCTFAYEERIPLLFDGVHFSKQGHLLFAKKMLRELEKEEGNNHP